MTTAGFPQRRGLGGTRPKSLAQYTRQLRILPMYLHRPSRWMRDGSSRGSARCSLESRGKEVGGPSREESNRLHWLIGSGFPRLESQRRVADASDTARERKCRAELQFFDPEKIRC